MIWVGLTGGIASGKSTVGRIFKDLGIEVISADQLSHDSMRAGSPVAMLLQKKFGRAIAGADGEIDRKKLGALIFEDTSGDKKRELEEILHPEVRKKADAEKKRLETRGDQVAIYEIPLLFEKNLESHYDQIVTVAVSPDVQISRLIARSGLSQSEAQARISAQAPQDLKIKKSHHVIWNDGLEKDLRHQVEKIARSWKTR